MKILLIMTFPRRILLVGGACFLLAGFGTGCGMLRRGEPQIPKTEVPAPDEQQLIVEEPEQKDVVIAPKVAQEPAPETRPAAVPDKPAPLREPDAKTLPPAPDRAYTQIVLEQVTAFQIDLDARHIDFDVVIRNRRRRDTMYLREVLLSDVQLERDGQPVLVGAGSGTVTSTIRPVAGTEPVAGIELPPGPTTNRFRLALPEELTETGANLAGLFNLLNAGPGKINLLFTLNGQGGVADPAGIEWFSLELTRRFSSDFDSPFLFDAPSDPRLIEEYGVGRVDIRRIVSSAIVTEDDNWRIHLNVEMINHDKKDRLVLVNPNFSQLAFHGADGHLAIGQGTGQAPGAINGVEGFPTEPGMELPPGVSLHGISIPMDENEAVAIKNLVDMLNILGDPARRKNLALLFIMRAKAGVKSDQGIEAFAEIETYKRLPMVVREEGIFK